jgi:hypothetical protein
MTPPSPPASRFVVVSLLMLLAPGCGDGGEAGGDPGGGSTGSGGPTETVCLDGAGQPADSCAVTPAEEICSLGDANACASVEREEVWADDGENGVCLHLVIRNVCDTTLYTYTCIDHVSPDSEPGAQCWLSTTPRNMTIDVSECDATGAYRRVSTTESGKANLLHDKCGF